MGIQNRLLAVVLENGVPAFDVVEGLDDRLSGHSRSEGAEVPLKVTDPQDELGDGGGAGVDLDAEELVRVNGVAGSFENRLGFAQAAEHIANFALQPLHVLHRHIEEIRGAARRVEDERVAQRIQEFADLLPGLGELPALRQRDGCGLDVGPLLAEGLDDRRQHQPLDVGPGRKVSAQLVPLVLVEGPLQQRSEDRGLDFAPLLSPGVDQQVDLLVGQGKRCGLVEQATIEAEHRLHENGRETARLHRGPERAGHLGKRGDPALLTQPAEHCREALLRQ